MAESQDRRLAQEVPGGGAEIQQRVTGVAAPFLWSYV